MKSMLLRITLGIFVYLQKKTKGMIMDWYSFMILSGKLTIVF